MNRRIVVVVLLLGSLLTGCGGPSPSSGSPSRSSPTDPWNLVAVGDSIPYGKEDCGECPAFPELFGAWIRQKVGRPVSVQNLSQHDNLTAARMAAELPQSSTLKQALQAGDIITVTIGHNDTPWNAVDDGCDADHGFFDGNKSAPWKPLMGPCLDKEVQRYLANLDAILTHIIQLRAGKPTAIRLTTQYNDVPGDPCCPPEATAVSAVVKNAFNKAACDVAARHKVTCIDVYHAFNGPEGSRDPAQLIAADHTHPSAAGQVKIAELLQAAGLAPLQ